MLYSRFLLVIYVIYSSVYISNAIFQFTPPLPPSLVITNLFTMWVYFCFANRFICIWYHVIFVFVWLDDSSYLLFTLLLLTHPSALSSSHFLLSAEKSSWPPDGIQLCYDQAHSAFCSGTPEFIDLLINVYLFYFYLAALGLSCIRWNLPLGHVKSLVVVRGFSSFGAWA